MARQRRGLMEAWWTRGLTEHHGAVSGRRRLDTLADERLDGGLLGWGVDSGLIDKRAHSGLIYITTVVLLAHPVREPII